MTDDDKAQTEIVAGLNAVEEDYAPECVQKDDAKCQCRACDEKEIGTAFQTHRARAIGIS